MSYTTKPSLVFGPVVSRRFGLSLGIDLSPGQKCCNYDCLYCELEKAPVCTAIVAPPSPEEILAALLPRLREVRPAVVTVTANGEPTLYPYLAELAERLRTHLEGARLLILSNGSTVTDEKVCRALRAFDIVKFSLDAATPKVFRKIDRPAKGIEIEALIEGMARFRETFVGQLVIEILVVEGLNDTPEEMRALRDALARIQPERIDLGTIARPPAYNVHGVSSERLLELSLVFDGLYVSLIPSQVGEFARSFDRGEILAALSRRPWSAAEAKALLDAPSTLLFERMKEAHEIEIVEIAGTLFYRPVHAS